MWVIRHGDDVNTLIKPCPTLRMTHSRNVLVVYVMTFSVSFWLAVFAVAADSASILPASDGEWVASSVKI